MTREEIGALLPFLANETLTGDERTRVETAVADDPALQQELQALRAIRATMQAEDSYSPAEIGLARLLRDVEKEVPQKRIHRPWVWQSIAAALLVAVVAQTLLTQRTADPGGYQLAGEDAAFVVGFSLDAREGDIRALLLDAGVMIVGGPSALGLYELAPIDGLSADSAGAILAASDLVESIDLPEED
ncbi:MAG: hypothetical protein GY717_02570 [Rhodobacteraceae bacterium]|nr:hypothetical protein [Paracoccaceae bacterium]